MALIYNGKTIAPEAIIKYMGTSIKKIVYKGVIVWQGFTSVSGISCSGGKMVVRSDGYPIFPTSSRGVMPSSACISWYGSSGAEVKALVNCKVTMSINFTCTCIDGSTWYNAQAWTNKNGATQERIMYQGATGSAGTVIVENYKTSATIELKVGERCGISIFGGTSSNGRTGFSGTVTFSAVPV